MGVMESLFGKRVWTTKETTETSTESEFGNRKTKRTETTTEKDSDGNVVSRITTTQELEREN
jgi:hypothetical protein